MEIMNDKNMRKKEHLAMRHAVEVSADSIVLVLLLGIWFIATGAWSVVAAVLFFVCLGFGVVSQYERRKEIAAVENQPACEPVADQE